MFASSNTVETFSNPMNSLDFFSAFPATTAGIAGKEEDDDWGDFVNSSDVLSRTESLPAASSSRLSKSPDPIGFFADRNGTNSSELIQTDSKPSRTESVKTSKEQWVKPRGPVPLSVFEEAEEEEGEGSGAAVENISFSSFSENSNKKNGSVNKALNTNRSVGINDLIANLYRHDEQSKPESGSKPGLKENLNYSDSNEKIWDWNSWNLNGNLSNSGVIGVHANGNGNGNGFILDRDLNGTNVSKKVSSSVASMENLSWNPLGLDTKRFDLENNVVNSGASSANLDSIGLRTNFVSRNNVISGANLDSNGFHSSGVSLDSKVLNLGFIDQNNDDDEDDGWEFKTAARSQTGDEICKVEGSDLKDVKGAEFSFGFENVVPQNSDFFSASSQQSSGWGSGFHFNQSSTAQNGIVSHTNFESKQDEEGKDLNHSPADGNSFSEEISWAFKSSFSETGSKHEKKEPGWEKPKGPLPLSLFGDGEMANDDSAVYDDISTSAPVSSFGDQNNMPGSNISISDLISSLYSQAVEKTSVDLTAKPSENGFDSKPTVTDCNLVHDDDEGFVNDSSKSKGHTVSVMNSNLTKGSDDFDDDTWEFKGAFLGNEAESHSSSPGIEDQDEKPITKMESNGYIDFFSELKNELCYVAINHLENLKRARGFAVDSGKGTEGNSLDGEIQDLHRELHEDILIRGGVNLENLPPKSICLDKFIEALQEPKFQAMESEYNLSKRLLLAEKDWKSTIELLKHAVLILNILTFGSVEEQSNYVSTWSRILSVCGSELKHGTAIWNQALEKSIQSELLSEPQGKSYFLALGEIYRVAEVINASVRLYKPWILLNPTTNIAGLLSECTTLWSSSGLEEALQRIISDSPKFDYNESASGLLDSVKYIRDLDVFALHSNVFSRQEPTCRISGLTTAVVQGMKMAEWNGECYFVKLANLWANLISSSKPTSHNISVNGKPGQV